jgi:hypothetical protein
LVYAGAASDAVGLEGDLVVLPMDDAFQVVGTSRIPLQVSGNAVNAGPDVEILTIPSGEVTVSRLAVWQGQLALLLDGGALPQVALIQRRP